MSTRIVVLIVIGFALLLGGMLLALVSPAAAGTMAQSGWICG